MELQIRATPLIWKLFDEQPERWELLGDRLDAAAHVIYGEHNQERAGSKKGFELQIQPLLAPLPALQRQNDRDGGRRYSRSSVTIDATHSWNRGNDVDGAVNDTLFAMIVSGLVQYALTHEVQERRLLKFPTVHVKQSAADHGGFHDGLLSNVLVLGCQNLAYMYLTGGDWKKYFPTLKRELIALAQENGHL